MRASGLLLQRQKRRRTADRRAVCALSQAILSHCQRGGQGDRVHGARARSRRQEREVSQLAGDRALHQGNVLFNLDKAKSEMRKSDFAVLVEGQMDCISVYMAGIRNVLAISGTAFTETQVRLLGRFTKRVIVNFDPDTAGRQRRRSRSRC